MIYVVREINKYVNKCLFLKFLLLGIDGPDDGWRLVNWENPAAYIGGMLPII